MVVDERTSVLDIIVVVDNEFRIFRGGEGVGGIIRLTGVDENENGSGRIAKSLLQID